VDLRLRRLRKVASEQETRLRMREITAPITLPVPLDVDAMSSFLARWCLVMADSYDPSRVSIWVVASGRWG